MKEFFKPEDIARKALLILKILHENPESAEARVQDKIGLSISRIDILSFKTTFDVKKKCGWLPVYGVVQE